MADKDPDDVPMGLEQHLREILRKANISFMAPNASQRPADAPGGPPKEPVVTPVDKMKPIREFDLKPRGIYEYLNRFVIKQDEAKKVLSVAICDHYNHVRRCLEQPDVQAADYAKHNMILLGPTGVGKTYLMRCISRLIGVPFVKADATKFTETGYVGHDVEDLVRDLVKAADGDTDLAQYGIIYVDEVDKIAAQSTAGGKDVSGRGVQINLLKIMEETDVSLFSQTDLIGQMQAMMDMQKGEGPTQRTINTRHMLFIVSGAFDHLGDLVQQRTHASRIGFTHDGPGDRADTEYLRLAETQDFIKYGFEPEFVGRLPVRVVCSDLDAGDLEEIMLSSEGSILSQYRGDFTGYGIEMSMARKAVAAVAEAAAREKTGARGLMTVLERLFRDFKFELPSTGLRSLDVTEDVVLRPAEALQRLLSEPPPVCGEDTARAVAAFAAAFEAEHGVRLAFNKAAREAIGQACAGAGPSVAEHCADLFRDLEHGLKLVARNTGRSTFAVTKKFVESPAEELSRRVAASVKGSGRAAP